MAGSKPGRPRTLGPRCGANTDHGPCRNAAGERTPTPGVGRCYRHGGCTPTQQVAARRTAAEEAARRFGVPVETTAADALLHELAVSRGILDFIRAQMAELTPEQLTQGVERVTRRQRPNGSGPGVVIEDTTVAKSMPNVWWGPLDRAQRHHAAVAAEIARLGIEQQRLKLAEEQAQQVSAMMTAILARMGLSLHDPHLQTVIGEVLAEWTDG